MSVNRGEYVLVDVLGEGISIGHSTDYETLDNKPSINGVELVGNKTTSDLNIVDDKHLTYERTSTGEVWSINHNLDKYPSVTVVDTNGNIVNGDITYVDKNNLEIRFYSKGTILSDFKGFAYLN